jgi:dTMP kinase
MPHRFKGKLIIVEGIDGSGKSTQLSLLSQWLRSQGIAVVFSEWNSSPLVLQLVGKEPTLSGDLNTKRPAVFSHLENTVHAVYAPHCVHVGTAMAASMY